VKTAITEEYRVSERVVLTPGMKFRAGGGPYYRLPDGTKVSLAARGPFTFLAHCKRGRRSWIDALDREGNYAPLHVEGRRRRITPALVPRPYVIRSTIRRKGGTQ
jgi:hypothetical protein